MYQVCVPRHTAVAATTSRAMIPKRRTGTEVFSSHELVAVQQREGRQGLATARTSGVG